MEKGSSGTAIRIENPNQFVPLYTDPQEVLEMRNKVHGEGLQLPWVRGCGGAVFPYLSLCFSSTDPGAKPSGREVGRAPVAAAGQRDRRDEPQPRTSPLPSSPSPRVPPRARGVTPLWGGVQSTESHLGDAEAKDASREEPPAEPEPPNPFSQLTDQELEEYKQEVERKKLGLQGTSQGGARGLHGSQSPFWGLQPSDQVDGKSVCLLAGEKDAAVEESQGSPQKSPPASAPQSPAKSPAPSPTKPSEGEWGGEHPRAQRRGAGGLHPAAEAGG